MEPMATRRIDCVTPGYYRYRKCKGGPWLPAEVSIENGMIYVVEADERLQVGITEASFEELVIGAVMEGSAFDSPMIRVAWFGQPIDKAEYDHLLDTIAWARKHMPDHPILRGNEPVKLAEVPVRALF